MGTSRIGAIARLLAVGGFLVLLTPGRVAAADPAPGSLVISVLPAKVDPRDGRILIDVANPGAVALHGVTISAVPPAGVTVSPIGPLAELGPQSAVVLTGRVGGWPANTPAVLVVRADATAPTGPVAGVASVDIAAGAPVTVTLAGTDRITDRSEADLTAVVTNALNRPVTVHLRVDAAGNDATAAIQGGTGTGTARDPLTFTVPARDTVAAAVTVRATGAVRAGKLSGLAVVSADLVPAPLAVPVTATKDLDVSLSTAAVLPGVLGVGTGIVVPGIVAVGLWLFVQRLDRRRVSPQAAGVTQQVWDNKSLLLVAVGVSVVLAYGCSLLGIADPLDTPTWANLAVPTALAVVLSVALSGLYVVWHRSRVPLVNERTLPRMTLLAAIRHDPAAKRPVHKMPDGRKGILVHQDRDKVVFSPQIQFSTPPELAEAADHNDLAAATVKLADPTNFRGHYRADNDWIGEPTAVDRLSTPQVGTDDLVVYSDDG